MKALASGILLDSAAFCAMAAGNGFYFLLMEVPGRNIFINNIQ